MAIVRGCKQADHEFMVLAGDRERCATGDVMSVAVADRRQKRRSSYDMIVPSIAEKCIAHDIIL